MQHLADEVLLEREKRVYIQQELIKKYNMPLVTIRVNYPGLYKENDISCGIIEIMDEVALKVFNHSLHFKLFRITKEGPIINMLIKDRVENIKKKTMEIEETHLLGRCVDIDVYDEFGNSISREAFGRKPRKCFVCEEDARVCVRERRHSHLEVVSFIIKTYSEYRSSKYGG